MPREKAALRGAGRPGRGPQHRLARHPWRTSRVNVGGPRVLLRGSDPIRTRRRGPVPRWTARGQWLQQYHPTCRWFVRRPCRRAVGRARKQPCPRRASGDSGQETTWIAAERQTPGRNHHGVSYGKERPAVLGLEAEQAWARNSVAASGSSKLDRGGPARIAAFGRLCPTLLRRPRRPVGGAAVRIRVHKPPTGHPDGPPLISLRSGSTGGWANRMAGATKAPGGASCGRSGSVDGSGTSIFSPDWPLRACRVRIRAPHGGGGDGDCRRKTAPAGPRPPAPFRGAARQDLQMTLPPTPARTVAAFRPQARARQGAFP